MSDAFLYGNFVAKYAAQQARLTRWLPKYFALGLNCSVPLLEALYFHKQPLRVAPIMQTACVFDLDPLIFHALERLLLYGTRQEGWTFEGTGIASSAVKDYIIGVQRDQRFLVVAAEKRFTGRVFCVLYIQPLGNNIVLRMQWNENIDGWAEPLQLHGLSTQLEEAIRELKDHADQATDDEQTNFVVLDSGVATQICTNCYKLRRSDGSDEWTCSEWCKSQLLPKSR